MDKRRQIFSYILLAIILPTVLLSPYHHHKHYSDNDCLDCARHITHWHDGSHGTDYCYICHFLSLPWQEAEEAPGFVPQWRSVCRVDMPVLQLCEAHHISLSARAPPVVFC